MLIDRDSPIPLYYQLKQLLLAQLNKGDLKPGDYLPTEQQIQEMHQVSRTTVRQALSELEEAGRITRQRGRGTMVTKPKLVHSPEAYPNLSDNMRQQGAVPGWKLLRAEWIMPEAVISSRLHIADDDKVFFLERLRLENDVPIGYHRAYVPSEFIQYIDGTAYTDGGSLRYLSKYDELATCVADRVIEAVSATEPIAAILNVDVGTALLRVKRIVFADNERPLEYFVGIYRGDRFEYHIHNMRAVSGINA